ncbi:glycosyltransferase family 2 protein [Natronogracilivirga saccharolytica]|uniref:Glycosyltransferase family 2 protein n=1 Tax=Natronogracilivirga saccharolytica TaxID=2812953 RepID=A0A8J7UVA6_9BACT|nr:glycosyltransferase family 2 protein [Natronogracilivirga saccharolytica]MBP3193250.1 glycosyltransferase family 2 protein [Natronogracilivirga saccharolytica]
MSNNVTCFLPNHGGKHTEKTIDALLASDKITEIVLLGDQPSGISKERTTDLQVDALKSSKAFRAISEHAQSDYILYLLTDTLIDPGQFCIDRMVQVADDTGAGIVYSDYREIEGDKTTAHPVTDYQFGSVRDDFDFGPLVLIRSKALSEAVASFEKDFSFAGWYDTRLRISQNYELSRISEFLYNTVATDTRKSGEKMFDYVDPKNRDVQIEMEEAFTSHLKAIGAYLKPEFKDVREEDRQWPVEASVVIPVMNRARTIRDAVESVLKQQTDYEFNLIVVDNYSTDGTTEILEEIAAKDKRLKHIIPQRKDLGIGGCWNEAVHSEYCGKYAIQLDSDDIYKDETTITRILEVFHKEKCAMVVGSYQMTDIDLNEIPPGIVDHREWTPENGRNNAIRINGLGAPRAFYTPVLRQIKIPNVSYGEDYAVGLAISRTYQIGRIYDPIYCVRRWDDNTDASLDIPRQNAHNAYKDKVRTFELKARQQKNAQNV